MQESNIKTLSEESISDRGYAEFRIKKSSVKWLVVFAVVLFVAFLGLLLASVLISTNITKDVNVQNGELVSSKDKKTVIKTSEKLYSERVSLDTSLEVVKNVKSISVYIQKSTTAASVGANSSAQYGVFKFYVTGFERIPGRKLVFHGHTHSANILADGSVQVIKSYTSNAKRDVDVGDGEYAIIESLLSEHQVSTYTSINTCSDLLSLSSTGNYRLEANLECTLTAPLAVFRGLLNGNGNTLTITLNRPSGEVALFQELDGAAVFNLAVNGSFTGAGRCAVFAVQALPGTSLVSNKAQANVVCNQVSSSSPILAAPFVAEVVADTQSTKSVTFQYLLSASNVTVDAGASSRQGGFFAVAQENAKVVSKYNYFFSYFTIADPSQFSVIGTVQGTKKRDWCNNPTNYYYTAYCWNEFRWNLLNNGQSDPTDTWWECCEAWIPCSGCMYYNDVPFCQFVLCHSSGGKRSEVEVDRDTLVRYVPIPFIQYP